MRALLRPAMITTLGLVFASAGVGLAQLSIEGPNEGPAIAPPGPASAPAASQPGVVAPKTQPAAGPTAEGVLQDLLQQKGAATGPAASGPAASGPALRADGLLPEGQLIEGRGGRLVKDAGTGAMQFVFDNPAGETHYPAMGVVPSRRLAVMEDASDRGVRPVTFRITAEVTEYRGKNYLYIKPSGSGAIGAASAPASGPASAPAVAASGPASMPAAFPLAAAHLEAVAPNEPPAPRMRETDTLYSRTGRLVKDEKTGAQVFVFDADGKQMQDAPMPIVPCKYLATMEDASGGGTKPVKFKISGEVTQYRGRNFIYVRTFLIVKDLGQGLGG